MEKKHFWYGALQITFVLGIMLVFFGVITYLDNARYTSTHLAPGMHTHDISYHRVIIHDSTGGMLQFETEDHMLYALQIIGAQPTALKPGQFANVYLRQIFEVKGSEGDKNVLSGWSMNPCTIQTPCALFLQAELLQKTDHDEARNVLKLSSPALEWR